VVHNIYFELDASGVFQHFSIYMKSETFVNLWTEPSYRALDGGLNGPIYTSFGQRIAEMHPQL
jgi:hypothetical protein